MLLILGCLYPIPLHQERQYHRTKTSLAPAKTRGVTLLPCLIQPALRKSYLSLKMTVTESVKRISLTEIRGARMLIRADIQALSFESGAPILLLNQGVAGCDLQRRREPYTL